MLSTWLVPLAFVLGGYLLGSISFSRIVTGVVDAEVELGSLTMQWRDGVGFDLENVSATAVASTVGPGYGCLAGLLDILKGFVPTLVVRLVVGQTWSCGRWYSTFCVGTPLGSRSAST